MTKRFDLAALAVMTAVLLLAASVRILNIDGPALWTDEGFVYYTFKINLFDAIIGDRHPPFYFYTLHAWEALTGDSILALRWWSMLPGMVTIAVMFQLGGELLRYLPGVPARTGALGLPVLVALMITLADAENYMAQELRMYTWHVLFAALSTWFYLRHIRKQNRITLGLYVAAGVLLMYTHYFGGFVLLVHGLHTLVFLRGRVRAGAIGALIAIGMLFMPWFIGATLEQFSGEAVRITTDTVDFEGVLLDFREKWFGQQWPLTLLLLGAGLYTLVQAPVHRAWGLAAMLVLLIAIPIILSTIIGHEELILLARRLVQITIPISILFAIGVARFPTQVRALIVVALVLYGVTTVDWYRVKVPWHNITGLITEYAQPGELVLAEVAYEESALLYYYDHMLPEGMTISTYPVWSDMPRFDYYEVSLPQLLTEQPDVQTDVITAWVTFFSPDEGILRKLEAAGFQRTMTRPYAHVDSTINVYRYDLMPQTDVETFDNGMVLRAFEIVPDDLRVDLWWSVEEAQSIDYVVSVALLNAQGNLVAQLDTQPQNNTRPISSMQPGEVVYDPHKLQFADGIDALPPGEYEVRLTVYYFADGNITPIPNSTGVPSITLDTLTR